MKDRSKSKHETNVIRNPKPVVEVEPTLEPQGLVHADLDFLDSTQTGQRADSVMRMQQTVGNRTVQRQVAPVQRFDLGGLFGGGGGGIGDMLGGLMGGGGGGGLGGMLGGLLGGGGGGLGGMLSGLLGGGGGGGGLGGMMSGIGGAVSGLVERGKNFLGGLF